MIAMIRSSLGKDLRLTYERRGKRTEVTLRPVPSTINGKVVGVIGFVPTSTYEHVGFAPAFGQSVEVFDRVFVATIGSLGMLVTHPQAAAENLSGPVGIARSAAAMQDLGWGPYFFLAAVLSLNLGIFNLLPFPALDGGRAAFIIAEVLRGKPVDPEKEALVHVAGFAFLMVVILVVTYHDITNILSGKGVLQ
jgi:regulator of sigma E protease